MANLFAELQMLANAEENTIADSRKRMNEIVSIFKALPDYLEQLQFFADLRKGIAIETLEAADAFMVDPDYPLTLLPEELRHDSLGFCNGFGYVYSGRFVYPVKDVKGDVAGWCGYDKFEQPKYLDSVNYGYHAKEGSMWGLEKMADYYSTDDPVFFTEGIVCALWLRQSGFQAMSLLGSYLSPYVIEMLKRLGRRCIIIPDADAAGNMLAKSAKYALPQARIIQSKIAKDIDDSQQIFPNLATEMRKYYSPFGTSEHFKRGA